MLVDEEVAGVFENLKQWHGQHVDKLKLITEHKDADMNIGGITVPANSKMAEGIRIGIGIALERLGTLPFTIEEDENGT